MALQRSPRQRGEVDKVALLLHKFADAAVLVVEMEAEVGKINMGFVGGSRRQGPKWKVVAAGIDAENRMVEGLDKAQNRVLEVEVVVVERGMMDLLCMGAGVGRQVRRKIRRRVGKAQEAFCGGLAVGVEYGCETKSENPDAVLHTNFLVEGGLVAAINPPHSACPSSGNQFVVRVLSR